MAVLKKTPAKTCSWCGTDMRGRTTCPRGPQCAKHEANHDALMERIETEARDKREKNRVRARTAVQG